MNSFNKFGGMVLIALLTLITGCIPTKVTYIGSAGYMLESPSKKILIDSPSADYVRQFEVPVAAPRTQDRIANAESPFDGIDLILMTHSHPGHFDPVILGHCLQNNPHAKLVANPAVYDIMAGAVTDFDLIQNRIIVVALDTDYQTADINVNGLAIHISRSPHWTRPDTTDEGYLYNYAFNLDGVEIVYALDQANYVKTADIDILFGGELESSLQPKHIVLDHQSGFANIAALAEQASVLDSVTFLTNSMQKALLIKHKDGTVSEHDVGSYVINYFKD